MAGVANIAKCFEKFSDTFSPKIVADLNGQQVKLASDKRLATNQQHGLGYIPGQVAQAGGFTSSENRDDHNTKPERSASR